MKWVEGNERGKILKLIWYKNKTQESMHSSGPGAVDDASITVDSGVNMCLLFKGLLWRCFFGPLNSEGLERLFY
jgi:hypothetical protein